MEIKEFNALTNKDKIRTLLDSHYLTTRIEKGCIVNLYELYDFFVEEFYDCQKNKIIRLRAYLAERFKPKLNKYDLV